MLSDDDDLDEFSVAPTQEERLTRADARREKLKREIQSKTGRDVSGKNLKQLKQELFAKDEAKVPKEDSQTAKASSSQTKTVDQRAKDAVETAQDSPDTDTLLDREQNAQPISGEEVQSEEG